MFIRTPQGLSNLNKFLEVDIIVFVEGGTHSYSLDEAMSGKFNDEAMDIKFWEGLFSIFAPRKRVEFRALGSCYTVRRLARKILEENITGVVCATDRDYDNYFWSGKQISGCITTWGYSWENDVCSSDKMFRELSHFSQKQNEKTDIINFYSKILEKEKNSIRKIMFMDYVLLCAGIHLIPREKPRKYIVESHIGIFCNYKLAFKKYKDERRNLKFSIVNSRNFQAKNLIHNKDVCGHFLMEFYFMIYCKIMRDKLNIPNTRKDLFMLNAIKLFNEDLRSNSTSELYFHYREQFKNLRIDS